MIKPVPLDRDEQQLRQDAADYWSASQDSDKVRDMSHWRNVGRFEDAKWHRIGENNRANWKALAARTGRPATIGRMVEWGPGGGSNAVAFAELAGEFYGVDISQANLEECQRQLATADYRGFHPILIPAQQPQRCLEHIDQGSVDFFLSTAVFQHFPSKQYGETIVGIVKRLLAVDGLAIIQTRFDDGSEKYAAKRRNYKKHASFFTSYRVEEFWKICESHSLRPLQVSLNTQINYAVYFIANRS